MNLAEYIRAKLRSVGVERAFGVPGYFVMPIWQQLERSPAIILARHETGAVFMADGYYRATKQLGVVLATTGPGATNCITGVACAYRDSIPLLVITGQAPTATFGRGAFLESFNVDRSSSACDLFAPITKLAVEIVDISNAVFLVDLAISKATSGRPGPVHLSIPVDLQEVTLPQSDTELLAALEPGLIGVPVCTVGAESVGACVRAVTAAKRPMILAGWGTMLSGANAELAALAEALDSPVISTAKAVGCLAENHPLRMGHLGPGQRTDIVNAITEYDPDLVLVLGASLSLYYSGAIASVLRRANVVRIDIDADALPQRAKVDLAIQSDVRAFLQAIVGLVPDRAALSTTRETVRLFRERGLKAQALLSPMFRNQLSMSGAMSSLVERLPDTALLLPDAGNHWLDAISLQRSRRAGRMELNCGVGAMGWGIGASVGMAFAARAPVVCITGDGSLLMHGTELSVATEHGLDLLVVAFNNRGHGRVRVGQKRDFNGAPVATSIGEIDLKNWAEAMGVQSWRVVDSEQLENALTMALETRGTRAIEIMCDPDEEPVCLRGWPELSSV